MGFHAVTLENGTHVLTRRVYDLVMSACVSYGFDAVELLEGPLSSLFRVYGFRNFYAIFMADEVSRLEVNRLFSIDYLIEETNGT